MRHFSKWAFIQGSMILLVFHLAVLIQFSFVTYTLSIYHYVAKVGVRWVDLKLNVGSVKFLSGFYKKAFVDWNCKQR